MQDEALRDDPAINAVQRMDRRTRAANYAIHFAAAAEARGITPDLGLSVLHGCGHDFSECANRADLVGLVRS